MDAQFVFLTDYIGDGRTAFGVLQDDGTYLLGDGDAYESQDLPACGNVHWMSYGEVEKALEEHYGYDGRR
jgi:hypothetical protein